MARIEDLIAADPNRLYGVDVYSGDGHNGVVDWARARAAGVGFAFAKATEGKTYRDQRFAANWAAMREAGLPRGAYHFYRHKFPGRDQARNFLDALPALEADDLPPVLDVEGGGLENSGRTPPELVAELRDWVTVVGDALGATPIIYTSRRVIRDYLGSTTDLGDCPLWVVDYQSTDTPRMPTGWTEWSFWQFTDSCTVDGVGDHVDVDRFMGTAADLQAFIESWRTG